MPSRVVRARIRALSADFGLWISDFGLGVALVAAVCFECHFVYFLLPTADYVFDGDEGGVAEELADLGGEDQGAGHYLAGGAVGYDLAVAEEDHAVGEVGGKLYVVGGEYDGVALVAQAAKNGGEGVLLQVVEAARRLVEDEGLGVAGEDGCQGHTLALAYAEVAGVAGAVAGEAEARQQLRAVGRQAVGLAGEVYFGLHGIGEEKEVGLLGNISHKL